MMPPRRCVPKRLPRRACQLEALETRALLTASYLTFPAGPQGPTPGTLALTVPTSTITPILLPGAVVSTPLQIHVEQQGNLATVSAHFADPAGPASYAATITWGDGAITPAAIAANPAGGLDLQGTHTYAASGDYALQVLLRRVTPNLPNTNISSAIVTPMTIGGYTATAAITTCSFSWGDWALVAATVHVAPPAPPVTPSPPPPPPVSPPAAPNATPPSTRPAPAASGPALLPPAAVAPTHAAKLRPIGDPASFVGEFTLRSPEPPAAAPAVPASPVPASVPPPAAVPSAPEDSYQETPAPVSPVPSAAAPAARSAVPALAFAAAPGAPEASCQEMPALVPPVPSAAAPAARSAVPAVAFAAAPPGHDHSHWQMFAATGLILLTVPGFPQLAPHYYRRRIDPAEPEST